MLKHIGGLNSWWWDFRAISDEAEENIDWFSDAESEHKDAGDSGGKPQLDEPMPVWNGERLLDAAGFRGHTKAISHICKRKAWHWGTAEDPVSVAIIWLLEEAERQGRNPAAFTATGPTPGIMFARVRAGQSSEPYATKARLPRNTDAKVASASMSPASVRLR